MGGKVGEIGKQGVLRNRIDILYLNRVKFVRSIKKNVSV